MELTKELELVLEKEQTQTVQAQQFGQVLKIVEDLQKRGLIDPPAYRLAPATSPSPHSFSGSYLR